MRHSGIGHLGFATLAICSLAACATSARLAPDQVKNEATRALNDYVGAINRGDTASAGAFYDRDADFHWIDRGVVQYRTAEAAAQSLETMTAQGAKSVLIIEEPIVADLSNSSAIISVRYRFEIQSADGTRQFGWQGWMTIAWVKREDGWKIAAGQAGPVADDAESGEN